MAETRAGERLLFEESGFDGPAVVMLPNYGPAVGQRPAQNRLSRSKARRWVPAGMRGNRLKVGLPPKIQPGRYQNKE